jgi:hypothetical protein
MTVLFVLNQSATPKFRTLLLPLQKDLHMGRVNLDGLGVQAEGLFIVLVGECVAALGKEVLDGRHLEGCGVQCG